jgi:hypothetical protein
LLAKRHNPHCSYHIVYMSRWEVKRSSQELRGRSVAGRYAGARATENRKHPIPS